MLTISWQVVPQVLNFLILRVITQVFQDGFQFRDMKLPTLEKNEVIKNRNWYFLKCIIFHTPIATKWNKSIAYLIKKKKRKLFMVTCEMSSTLSTIKTYYGSQGEIYLWFISGALSTVFKRSVFRRNLIIYYVNYIQFYLYSQSQVLFLCIISCTCIYETYCVREL